MQARTHHLRYLSLALGMLLATGTLPAAEKWIAPRAPAVDFVVGNWALAGAETSYFTFAVPEDLKTLVGARVVIVAGQDGSVNYDLGLSVSENEGGHALYTDASSGSVATVTGAFTEIDAMPLLAAAGDLNPGVDYIGLSVRTPGMVRPIGMRFLYEASSGPLHIVGDVEGPPLSPTALGNEAEPFVPEHHVAIIENTRATESEFDDTRQNTGGLAIILHSHGDDDLPVFDLDAYDPAQNILKTINRNDHFVTFFRENLDGSQEIVGRIEGISFWDIGEMNQLLIDFFAQSGHLPWNFLKMNVTFNDPSTWLQWTPPSLSHPGFQAPTFGRGTLPYFAYNNNSCEGQSDEVCIDLGVYEIDLTWRTGTLPSVGWGSLDDPLMGLQLDPGSLSGTPPIEFGDPFIVVDQAEVNAFTADAGDLLGSVVGPAVEMTTDPLGFATKYFLSLRGGVTYESGSGDYAEWLERMNPEETLEPAEIVGVFGGKVTRKTEGADQAMVVSYKPIVLGNTPAPERQERFDKIAFMGQTLVKVWGTVRGGDFIVPSGRQDGTGVAVSPEKMTPDQYGQVVGVAWGHGGLPGRLGVVNVAVGLRPAELAKIVGEQAASLGEMREQNAAATRQIAALEEKVGSLQVALAEMDQVREQLQVLSASVERLQTATGEPPRLARTID